MKTKKKFQIKQMYRLNEETGAYMIEISLDNYDELFNGWDASAIRRKELEPELFDYLVSSSYEISLKHPLEIWFYIEQTRLNEEKERLSQIGIDNHFKSRLHINETKLKSNYRKILIYILMSIGFLTFAYLVPNQIDLSIFIDIMVEGLFIGGWVLLWEAFSIFFFDSYDLRMRKKHLLKLKHSRIHFHHQSS